METGVYHYVSPILHRVSRLRHPVTLIVLTVLFCYFIYPSWKLLNFSSEEFIITAALYVFSMVLLLRLTMWTIHHLDIDNKKPNKALCRFEVWILFFGGLCFLLGHFYYIGLPIFSGPDEPVHVSDQLWNFKQYQETPGLLLFALFVTFACLAGILSFLVFPADAPKSISFSKSKIVNFIVFLVGVFLLVVLLFWLFYELLDETKTGIGLGKRWPPIGTILASLSFTLFGENEFGARFPSSFFFLGTGYYVYRILRGNSSDNWKIGVCGVLVCLCCPLFFIYGHLDYREMGGAFFLTLGMYYLIRYLQEDRHQHLLVVAFAIIAGFLHRRPVGVMLFVSVIFVLLYCVTNRLWWADRSKMWLSILLWLLLCASIGLAILPWIYITRDVRPYHFLSANFLNIKYLTAYMRILPQLLSWPITVLFCLGLVASLIKRSLAGLVACIYLLALYLLFTGDRPDCIPTFRFTVLFIPFLAIIAANFLGIFSNKSLSQYVLLLCIGVLSFSSLLIWHSSVPAYGIFPAATGRFSSLPYYPFNDLVKFLKDKGIPHGAIIYPEFWQTSSQAYYMMYNIDGYADKIPWPGKKYRRTTMPAIKEYCDKYACTALILRMKKEKSGNVGTKFLPGIDFTQLKENRLDDFRVEEIFFHGDNGIALLVPK